MEIKFNQTSCRCLRRVASGIQVREQTQEVRLPDAMPDIGRVLGCWGQVLLRGKEWRSGGMGVNGGVMAWVLYAPEDGSEPRTIDAWIPFQMKWEFPETERDGFICVDPRLRSIDARSTSARKLMVRANISAKGQALEGIEEQIMQPVDVPEDMQLLTNVYPMELPQEFGEKQVQLDEELTVNGTYPPVEKIIRYEMNPQITEKKVMASRVVFRGKGMLHLVYFGGGKVCCWDGEIPFSQYADLDRDYGPNSNAEIIPVITNLELDMSEGRLLLKCGMTAQFVISDRVMVELTEDAYSPVRSVKLTHQELSLPQRLEIRTEQMTAAQTVNAEAERVLDVNWLPDHPQPRQGEEMAALGMGGIFQVLYQDTTGNLQCASVRYEQEWELPADSDTLVDGVVHPDGEPQAVVTGQGIEISAAYLLDTTVYSGHGNITVTGIEAGEAEQPDPMRPSLILQRYDSPRLWDTAKACGSTVETIRIANGLQGEPEKGQMLLIPIS